MTTLILLRICFLSTCPNILFNDNQLKLLKDYIVARKAVSAAAATHRSRQRRSNAVPASLSSRGKRRRSSSVTCNPEFLQHVSQSFARSKIAPRRHAPRAHPEQRAARAQLLPPIIMEMPPTPSLASSATESSEAVDARRPSTAASAASSSMPQSEVSGGCMDEHIETRSVRSCSSASRNPHRLSLTLPIPIALPTSTPSRPTPAASVTSSYPSTPVDTPGIMSPVDPNNFITAIAAQERRVLDLREELSRAERELTNLKRQFARHEANKKIQENRSARRLRDLAPRDLGDAAATEEDPAVAKRNAELERRKAFLLGRQSAPGTPKSGRRVFQGGHTRTLSLLSPTKTDPGDFSVHEDAVDQLKTSSKELDEQFANIVRYAPITPAQLSKRASWAPRTVHQQATSGVKQIAEDFRTGLWTFVEDLRQATVGDEPITGIGQPLRAGANGARSAAGAGAQGEDQETIRASVPSTRTHVATAFEQQTPTPAARFGSPLQEETGNGNSRHQRKLSRSAEKPKRWSWTPLTMDSLDDSDWSSWDSPPVKSPRWSGTTVNGDAIPTIPEKLDENDALRKDSDAPTSPTPSMTGKLEELPYAVLNRLTPSKLRQQASDYIKEWERSLTPPGSIDILEDDKFKAV